ncbi:hypothetical protein C8J57DRAFT_1277491 [Mycena rebaudengoi]|nr:hypothetical protein C8J57DRAFT_1277491 [Mycena rebaudengoi]
MDVLTVHPELASGMFKVISDALTDAQKTVQDLQRTLNEQRAAATTAADGAAAENLALSEENARLRTAATQAAAAASIKPEPSPENLPQFQCQCEENETKVAQLTAELSELRAESEATIGVIKARYNDEKTSGDELRLSLEERYSELRESKIALDMQKHEIAAFAPQRQLWSAKEVANQNTILQLDVRYQNSQVAHDKALREVKMQHEQALAKMRMELLAQQGRILEDNNAEWLVKQAANDQALQDLRAHCDRTAANNDAGWSAKIQAQDKALQDLGSQYVEVLNNRSKLREDLQARDSDIEAKAGSLKELQHRIEELEEVLQGRNSDINAKEGTLRERGQRIKELKENLQKAMTMCSEANEARERLNTELEQRNTLQNQAEHAYGTLYSNYEHQQRIGIEREAKITDLLLEKARIEENWKNAQEASEINLMKLDRQQQQNLQLGQTFMRTQDEHSGLKSALMDEINDLNERLNRSETARAAALGEFEVQKAEHAKLQEASEASMLKLREENKNLRSSVLQAGAQAREELMRATEDDRAKALQLKEDNTRLQDALNYLQGQFPEATTVRDDMAHQAQSVWKTIDGQMTGQEIRKTVSNSAYIPGRSAYNKHIATFLPPSNRPPFDTLEPVYTNPAANDFTVFCPMLSMPPRRPLAHFPKRTIWAGTENGTIEKVHAMFFHPTHVYNQISDTWGVPPECKLNIFDLFINKKSSVYYAGVYMMHSMKDVHPPGDPVPFDVSESAIQRAAGLTVGDPGCAAIIGRCFPDGKIKTECFALQCIAFDHELYQQLRKQFQAARNLKKRKASSGDLREDGTKGRLQSA